MGAGSLEIVGFGVRSITIERTARSQRVLTTERNRDRGNTSACERVVSPCVRKDILKGVEDSLLVYLPSWFGFVCHERDRRGKVGRRKSKGPGLSGL